MVSASQPSYAVIALKAVQNHSRFGSAVSRFKIRSYFQDAYNTNPQPGRFRDTVSISQPRYAALALVAIRRCVDKGELVATDATESLFKLTPKGTMVLAAKAGGILKRQRKKATATASKAKGRKAAART